MTSSFRLAYTIQNAGVDLRSDVGPAILIKHTVRGLEEAGHQVDLVWLAGRYVRRASNWRSRGTPTSIPTGLSGALPFKIGESGVRRVQRLTHFPYLALFDSYRFYEGVRRALAPVDLCHEYGALLSIGTAWACRRLDKPYVLTVDADLFLEREVVGRPLDGLQKVVAAWEARLTYRLADRILCVSDSTRVRLIKHWGVSPDKIDVIPNGVDLKAFADGGDAAVTRRRWGIPTTAPVVMFVGGFQPWHGLGRLVESFAQVVVAHPEARLMLVGDGPFRPQVETAAAQHGLTGQMTITGMVPHQQVPALLNMADVVVVPYPRFSEEMWFSPLKLYEYMAAGKAIIASRAGQIEAVIEDGQNGLLVPPGDTAVLAQTIVQLLRDPAQRGALGQAAQRQARQRHSWRSHITRLERSYAQALDAHS